MKKYIGIALVLICILSLTTCGSNKKITLPDPKNISEIEIIKKSPENTTKIENKNEISKIIIEIEENTLSTIRESINDQPTNIDEYITIKFHHKNTEEGTSIAYLYKYNNASYIELPYLGIWKLSEEISNSINGIPKK